jgi:hypothetical protein
MRIGLLVSRSGSAGLWEEYRGEQVRNAAVLAAQL